MDFSSLYDPLFCQEDHFTEEKETDQHRHHHHLLTLNETEEEENEADQLLCSLLSNELKTHPKLSETAAESYLIPSRTNAVKWVKKTCFQHNFSSQTLLLAINYLDRCFLSHNLRLQKDKPWMGRLAAVASLSLAAKVEEKRVPMLVDLQVGNVRFENRTVCRMELLMLSALGWRMNAVTALSLARRLICKISVDKSSRKEVLRNSEIALLAVVDDLEWVRYQPSVWAAAALVYAVRRPEEIAGASPERDILLNLLNVSKESVGGAYQLILEHTGNCIIKRKHFYQNQCSSFCTYSSLLSPNCLLGSCFTCENSSSSGNSLDSSLQELPPFKKPNTKTKQITNNGESKELLI